MCDKVGENMPFVPIFTITAPELTNLNLPVNGCFSHSFIIVVLFVFPIIFGDSSHTINISG